MKQKDLAKEYAHKAFLKRNRINPMSIHDLCFSMTDIKAAFNAGRESVVENIPELQWKNLSTEEEYHSSCLLGWSYRIMQRPNVFALFCNDHFLNYFLSVEEAKQAASEDYKERIKQVLGL